MSEIVEKLREHDAKLEARGFGADSWMRGCSLEAASHIEALEARNKRLEEELAKIVPSFEKLVAETDDEFTASDEEILNAARSALRGE
jgi:hypothetical protein